ncbi:TPA: hypothetical protein ACGP7K_003147 [Escherichia coli]|nr:hypothetical protein [Escherichia coli]GDC45526.1 hypothetical protein HmCmsJML192_00458 [Escherichia coli]
MLDRRESGSYSHLATENKWEAWQASRAAIGIELPVWFVSDAIAVYDRDDIDEAIRAAGVKVKE